MWLTKNEKKVLKLLVDNAKLSDTSIANKLNISSQAVGKIRKHLEENIIKGYTLEVDLSKLDINVFALSLIKFNSNDEVSLEEIEDRIKNDGHCTLLIRTSGEGNSSHIICGGFKNLNEFQNLFENKENIKTKIRFIDRKETHLFSTEHILKNSSKELLIRTINELGTKHNKNNHRNNNSHENNNIY